MGRPAKILTKEEILAAHSKTKSNLAAARYLHVSYPHYKKYAKLYTDENGTPLLEVHKNQSGKGIPKFLTNNSREKPLMDLIEGRIPIEHFNPQKVKERMFTEGLLEQKCYQCGFKEKRVIDQKVPLIVDHKDGNRKNWKLDNVQCLCYNCAFLYGQSPVTDEQVEAQEHYVDQSHKEFDWEMDETTIEHLKQLGLYEDDSEPGSEFISRL